MSLNFLQSHDCANNRLHRGPQKTGGIGNDVVIIKRTSPISPHFLLWQVKRGVGPCKAEESFHMYGLENQWQKN